jgi:hypothetical protein
MVSPVYASSTSACVPLNTASSFASVENAIAFTVPVATSAMKGRGCPLSISQTRMVSSSAALAAALPSGLAASSRIGVSCPTKLTSSKAAANASALTSPGSRCKCPPLSPTRIAEASGTVITTVFADGAQSE